MNPEIANALMVLGYLAFGTTGIALLMGWALKHLGPAKPRTTSTPEARPPKLDQDQH